MFNKKLMLAGSLFMVSIVGAQIPASMSETYNAQLGGNNFITGTVFWPSGQPVDRRLGLRLRTPHNGDIMISTDTRGQFIVGGLPEGYYYVTIDREDEFEAISAMVEIIRSRDSRNTTYSVTLRLREKLKLQPKPSVVDASLAGAPKRAAQLYNRSVELSAKGDHTGAIEQLKLAILESPEFLSAHNELGVQYMRTNQLELADEALQKAIKLKPDAFEPLLNRAIVLIRLKRYAESEVSVRLAITSNPASPVAHYYLGRALTALDKLADAETELKLAIELGGASIKEAHRMLADLYIVKGNDKKAIEELEKYLSIAPDAPDADKLKKVIAQLKAARPMPPSDKP